MTQQLVTFSDYALNVDSLTSYECWKNGDIASVRFDGQVHFVSSDLHHDLASEGLIHQDGICGKGWIGNTGFCKRVNKIKGSLETPEGKRKAQIAGGLTLAGGAIALAAASYSKRPLHQRRARHSNINDFIRKNRDRVSYKDLSK